MRAATAPALKRPRDAFAAGIRPRPRLTVAEWADRHRVLSSIASGEPGQWKTERTPYLREIMERLSPSDPTETVVLMKGAQLGATECGNNWIGYVIHQHPGPLMLVMPTVGTMERTSKQRIQPMIDGTPALRERVQPARKRDAGNTIAVKEFPGGVLVLTGANSAAGLRSMPIRDVFCDEIDAYPPDADGEGDPLELAFKRQETFGNRKRLLVSTPTIRGVSRIEGLYLASDQRRYFVPCPFCDAMQLIAWKDDAGNPRIVWPEGKPRKAVLLCASCARSIEDRHKGLMLPRGEWRATVEDTSGGRVKGYHLSSLYSPHGWRSWGAVAETFVAAKGEPTQLQVFVNTDLGETWDAGIADLPDRTGLLARREPYGPEVPAPVLVLTAGVDVQRDRLETEVVGWGPGQESWSVAYARIWGDPTGPQVWRDLDAFLLQPWPRKGAPEMRVAVACVDTGDSTQRVYEFVQGKHSRRVFGVKGHDGDRPVWNGKPRKVSQGKVNLYVVGVDTAKRDTYARLKITRPGPGFCHFPMERDSDYFEQLTAERAVPKTSGKGFRRLVWVKPPRARNEALDCRVYAYAALHAWLQMGNHLDRPAPPSQHPPVTRRPPSASGRGRWLDRIGAARRGERRGLDD